MQSAQGCAVAERRRISRRPCFRIGSPYSSRNEIVGTTNRSIDAIPSLRCQTIQSGEYQPIELAECRPLRRFTSQDVQLMAQHQDFSLQRDPRWKKPDQRTPDQSAELDHQAGDSPDSPPPANRIRFPTMTSVDVILARH